jgi:hypothetical protein
MASGSNAPFSGEFDDLENIPKLPEGVTASEATEKLSIDNQTLKINNNGNVFVNTAQEIIVGEFDSSLGSWNTAGGGIIDKRTTNGGAESTSGFARINAFDGETSEFFRDFDLSGIDQLVFFYKGDPEEDGAVTGNINIVLGNTTIFSKSSLDNFSWNKVVTDVSDISTTKELRVIHNGQFGNGGQQFGFDRVKLVETGINSNNPKITFDGAGE